MSWFHHYHQIKQKDGYFQYPSPLLPPPYAPTSFHKDSSPSPPSSSSGSRISPALLFIIVILAVLFFISGLLHLLVRFLTKHPPSSTSSQSNRYPEISTSDALQRQLQQLFHLHDSGLDQAFIDALPVFHYKEIVGLKEPFDCAVCLCEFSEKDKLRLLPMCSHAFHINCIDTWLLSNSTCPLCRGTLFTPGFSMENPMFEFDEIREDEGLHGQKTMEIEEIVVDKGVLPVRLGKFKRLDGQPRESLGETSSSNLDARRCFSMGSYQYVLGASDLRVTLSYDKRHGCDFKPSVAVLFFISGLLHLLVRFLTKHPPSSTSSQSNRYPEISTSDALQRQLQQLFHLHDSGLDQAFIDALPVFHYKEIVGLKEPFDCAVCLCEFSEKDKLRLLPMCSHAFHINCIDTWLLSNSTCPLCRGTLFTPGFSMENPMFEFDEIREDEGLHGQKTMEIEEIVVDKGVLPVRLGKFKRLDGQPRESLGETSSSNLDARRCFSMGSYQYVLGASDLRVTLSYDKRHGCDFKPSVEGKKISSASKGESFSVSKIWLWSKKGKLSTSSSDEQMGMPSSLSTELPPWLVKTQEK
ncbi:hypothetical protein GOBAR_AA02563 [Gossypium barbadense]|uniref:RING-type E3 ubiquitin transferase n=1 Tax=Gossypium barbadense TaxID=3634 RepID=A0A2P5YR26_GOSBA|nr:hypothetical protein GOBAR_AA02563 [Gossypium barbadense]